MRTQKWIAALIAAIAFTVDSAVAEPTVKAFVVGIGDYEYLTTLPGPVDDVRRIKQELSKLGHKTIEATTPSETKRTSLLLKWQAFLDELKEGDDAVIYYSGHAVEISGSNYIVPIDTPSAETIGGETALKSILISLQTMMGDVSERRVKASVWILDACRDNPFVTTTKSLGSSKGLGDVRGLSPMFIFYAANFGQAALASTSQSAPNSLYTWALADLIAKNPNASVAHIASDVRRKVREIAKVQPQPHNQRPAYYDGLDEPWCFGGCSVEVAVLPGATYTTPSISVVATPARPITKVVTQNSKNVTPNAVYLGRQSAKNCTGDKPSGLHPFGCPLLQKVEAGDVKKFIGVDLKPKFPVNIRKAVPTVTANQQRNYSCPVQVLDLDQSVKLTGITSIPYENDVFYWGTVAGTPKDCMIRETSAIPVNAAGGR